MTNLVEKTKHLSSSILASPVMEPFRASAFRRQGSLDEESSESIEFELDTSTKEDQIFSPRPQDRRPGVPGGTPNPAAIPKPKFERDEEKKSRAKSSKSESEDDTDTSFSIRIVFVLYLLVLSWENPDILGTEAGFILNLLSSIGLIGQKYRYLIG